MLNALSIAGLTKPVDRQIQLLIGTAAAPGVPWALDNAFSTGNLDEALVAADGLNAIPVIAYLANRALEAALVAEAGADSQEAAMAAG